MFDGETDRAQQLVGRGRDRAGSGGTGRLGRPDDHRRIVAVQGPPGGTGGGEDPGLSGEAGDVLLDSLELGEQAAELLPLGWAGRCLSTTGPAPAQRKGRADFRVSARVGIQGHRILSSGECAILKQI